MEMSGGSRGRNAGSALEWLTAKNLQGLKRTAAYEG